VNSIFAKSANTNFKIIWQLNSYGNIKNEKFYADSKLVEKMGSKNVMGLVTVKF
jgi:hypothetical protein